MLKQVLTNNKMVYIGSPINRLTDHKGGVRLAMIRLMLPIPYILCVCDPISCLSTMLSRLFIGYSLIQPICDCKTSQRFVLQLYLGAAVWAEQHCLAIRGHDDEWRTHFKLFCASHKVVIRSSTSTAPYTRKSGYICSPPQ